MSIDARRVAAELGKLVEGPPAHPAEDKPRLRVVVAENCHHCNPLKADTTKKDNAVEGGLRIRPLERESVFKRQCKRGAYRRERPNEQSASRCCCQPSHAIRTAQHCPESCNRADQN